MNPYKSPGADYLHPRISKELSVSSSVPLSILYTESFKQQKLPQDWKDTVIRPLYKKDEKCLASNYRPISLTSIICKIIESIIKDDLMSYVCNNNIITSLQHGFLPGRSFQSNLLIMLNCLTEAIDRGIITDVIYLDFAKAFDSVPHNRLIYKLSKYGITGNLLHWISDFLSKRRQCVHVNSALSEWESVISGVPQGSILGPILFIFYINDLPADIIAKLLLFADDAKLIKMLLSMMSHSELQNDLNHLISWSEKWQLKFTKFKVEVLLSGQTDTKSYTMLNIDISQMQELQFIEEGKDLGVIIDSKLKFSSHIVNQLKKANRLMRLIQRSCNLLDIVSFKYLFISVVRPHLEYCVLVWYPLLKKDEDLIENFLRRASKMLPLLSNITYKERLAKIEISSNAWRYDHGL